MGRSTPIRLSVSELKRERKVNEKSVLALPIRSWEKSTKRILFELKNGERFYLVGGRDDRPRTPGIAHFSPHEMITILKNNLSEENLIAIIKIKKVFGGGVEAVETLGINCGSTLQAVEPQDGSKFF